MVKLDLEHTPTLKYTCEAPRTLPASGHAWLLLFCMTVRWPIVILKHTELALNSRHCYTVVVTDNGRLYW